MKKLLSIIALTMFSYAVTAQGVNFGVKAGVNFANVVGDEADSWESKTAFHAGVVADLSLSEKISIRPGLIYSAQGADYSESEFSGTVNLDYLNIPVMGVFEVAEGFSLQVGPQVGILLSAKDKEDGEPDFDVKEFVKSTDFGINLGLGYELANGLNFGAQYNLGLSDLNDDADLSDEGVNWKNSVIQVSIGYFFGSNGGND